MRSFDGMILSGFTPSPSSSGLTSSKKASTVSGKIKGLKAGKTYYVRIRTYKKVGKELYYSTWSDKMKEGFPTEVSGPIDSTGAWMEGPTMIYIGDDLLIYYDKYKEHRFGAALSHDDGCSWKDVSDRISLPKGTRHGTAIAVPRRYVDAISQ